MNKFSKRNLVGYCELNITEILSQESEDNIDQFQLFDPSSSTTSVGTISIRCFTEVFYGVLVQYFAMLATQITVNLKIIYSLVRPLIDMSTETPYFAAICARQQIIQIRSRFCDDLKIPRKSGWPSLKTVMLMRLWSLTFPCTDFRHPVMPPMLLLICEYLMRCQIESSYDLAVGRFLCSILLSKDGIIVRGVPRPS